MMFSDVMANEVLKQKKSLKLNESDRKSRGQKTPDEIMLEHDLAVSKEKEE